MLAYAGVTNDYLCRVHHPLALRYNDKSELLCTDVACCNAGLPAGEK